MLTRKLISIFFLFTMLVNMNFRFLVITDYCINTEAYSKNCINKTKPELNCNGKCQMNQKIAAVEESDMSTNHKSLTENKKINLYNYNANQYLLYYKLELKQSDVNDSRFIMAISSNFFTTIFKPPCS